MKVPIQKERKHRRFLIIFGGSSRLRGRSRLVEMEASREKTLVVSTMDSARRNSRLSLTP
jgi:hypothetical protein